MPRAYENGAVSRPAPDEPARLWRPNDAEYEAAHGMEPLADLHAEREQIAARFAELKPRFGPAKMFEHERKALLSLVSMELRQEWDEKYPGVKATVDAVDAAAHIDPRYAKLLADGLALAVEYEGLAIKMGNLEERSARGQVIGRLRASEAHMEPAGA